MNPGKARVEANRVRVGNEVDLMAARGEFEAKLRSDDAASSVGGVTGDADLHSRRVTFRLQYNRRRYEDKLAADEH